MARHVCQDELAARLGLPVADLQTLERTDVALWELGTLAAYVRALDLRLDVAAVEGDGRRIVLLSSEAGQ